MQRGKRATADERRRAKASSILLDWPHTSYDREWLYANARALWFEFVEGSYWIENHRRRGAGWPPWTRREYAELCRLPSDWIGPNPDDVSY